MGFNEIIYIYGQEREIVQYFSTTFEAFSSVYNTIWKLFLSPTTI